MADDAAADARHGAMRAGAIGVLVLTALAGWLGLRAVAGDSAEAQRDLFVRAARRTATELTTVDYQHVQDDVQRVLDSTTGDFHQSFADHSASLIDTVTRDRTESVSAITEAGIESQSGTTAAVLVAVSVASTQLGGTDLPPHGLRMRLTVQRVGDDAKVSDVEYVR